LGAPAGGGSLYLGTGVALGVVAELLHRERQAAERLAPVDPLTGLPTGGMPT
jgi:hypothetical protein